MNTLRRLLLIGFLLGGPAVAAAQEEKLTFYGFFDFEMGGTNERGGPNWSFRQHHLNVVSIYQVEEHWRVFTEIEYEDAPSVKDGGGGFGEVTLERGALEYQHSDAVEVRMGRFLTPFGLYNERHDASPSILSTSLPSAVYSSSRVNALGETQQLFAKFATGAQLLGTLTKRGWEADYAVYVSNGRGPAPSEQDNNANKAVGGRLALRLPAEIVQFGASFYDERNGEVANTRQQSLGFDVRVRYFSILVESEALIPRLEKVNAAGLPNGTYRTARGYYLQISRPFTDALTPFARFDSFDNDIAVSRDRESEITAGLNLAARRTIFFKSEIHFRNFQDPTRRSNQLYLGSVAVAF